MTDEISMNPWRWGSRTEAMVHYLVYDETEGWVVSMYLEGVGWFSRGTTPYLDPSEGDLLHSVTHRSFHRLSRLGPMGREGMS